MCHSVLWVLNLFCSRPSDDNTFLSIYFFKCQNNMAPPYLQEFIQQYTSRRSLRSATHHLLEVPPSTNNYGATASGSAGPKLWNELPLELRNSNSLTSFKSKLKIHLFRQFYSTILVDTNWFVTMYFCIHFICQKLLLYIPLLHGYLISHIVWLRSEKNYRGSPLTFFAPMGSHVNEKEKKM